MMYLIISLFISMSWATDGCDELLSAALSELEHARSKNQSLRIRGEISQYQFDKVKKELDAKDAEIRKQNPSIEILLSARKSRAKVKDTFKQEIDHGVDFDNSDLVFTAKKLYQLDVPEGFELVDYDFESGTHDSLLSLLDLSKKDERNNKSLHHAHKDILQSGHIPLDMYLNTHKIPFSSATFTPDSNNLILVHTEGEGTYTYHINTNESEKLDSEHLDSLKVKTQFSRTGKWAYPKTSHTSMPVYKDMPVTGQEHIVIPIDSGTAIPSPDEKYFISWNSKYIQLHRVADRSSSYQYIDRTGIQAVTMSMDGKSVIYFGISCDVKSVNTVDLFKNGKPSTLRSQSLFDGYIVPIHSALFSPNGRFLAVIYTSGLNIMKLKIYDVIVEETVADFSINDGDGRPGSLHFTPDSHFVSVYGKSNVEIFQISPAKIVEVVE